MSSSENEQNDNVEIDDSLYSRQRYVLGDKAMKRILTSTVLVSGMTALGVEIAKNICLAGVRTLTLHDTKDAVVGDQSGQFFVSEGDVGQNRAQVSQKQIAELNPHVTVTASTDNLLDNLDMLLEYKCVVLTDADAATQAAVAEFCHANNICFILSDVRGAFFQAFVDFGEEFEVNDSNGERELDVTISQVTQEEEGKVTTLEDKMHGFETGDYVRFDEVIGMTELNGKEFEVKVLSPTEFTIGDTREFSPFGGRGQATQVKKPFTVSFKSLAESIAAPEILPADFGKFEAPMQMHVGFQALGQFAADKGALPAPWNKDDVATFLQLAKDIAAKHEVEADEAYLAKMACTAQGSLPALAAFGGGVIGQEALKALTGKYTPLSQWLYLDTTELVPSMDEADLDSFQPRNDRYDHIRMVIGQALLDKLMDTRLFMVGSGAIGCEMLKNFAMGGVACGDDGLVTMTDNDIIEKSNLNRQFLFRNTDIQKPKSETAAAAVQAMNPDIKIDPHLEKVGPETEDRYSDEFFQSLNLVVNALDNVNARLYMDGRAVTNRLPLLESGTLGPKGHVQVVVPYKTESYGSSRDPPEKDVPMCTLKSFPSEPNHTIQFFRSKFQSLLSNKPQDVNKFLEQDDFYEKFQQLGDEQLLEVRNVYLFMHERKLTSFEDCVQFARIKFEKYFRNKILQLLHNYPLDLKMKDGSDFWKLPKRPPQPLEFDADNQLHMDFILSLAQLMARIYKLNVDEANIDMDVVRKALDETQVPEFKPVDGKHIETDEKASEEDAKKKEAESPASKLEQIDRAALDAVLKDLAERKAKGEDIFLAPEDFEKDDDSNHHIDFITAGSNLRASQYGVRTADRIETKGIAGKIIPAIATTTSAVAGLVTIEMLKLINETEIEGIKNTFMNLALPFFALTEPGAAPARAINDKVSVTMWDRWDVNEGDMTVQQFMDYFLEKYALKVTGIFNGVSQVYNMHLPMHKKRLSKTLGKLIKNKSGDYADLTVTFVQAANEEEEVNGPPVRFFFG